MANRYWVGGTGNWSDSGMWSSLSGGFGGATVPGVGDTAIFDANSDVGSNFTATVDSSVTVDNLTFTGVDRVITLGSAENLTVTGATNIGASASTNGVKLSGNPTLGAVTITAKSTFDLDGNTLSATSLTSNIGDDRTFAFGTNGVINITGNNGTVCNLTTQAVSTVTGSGTINFTYSGSTGTRTVIFFADTGSEAIDVNVTAGSDGFTIGNNTVCKSLNFTGFSGTFTNNDLAIYGSLTISSGMTVAASNQTTIFAGTSSHTITTNGKTLDFPITFNGVGGTWTLQDNLTTGSTRTTTLTNGSLILGSRTLTTGIFSSSNINVRTLDFGTGKIVVTASGANATVFSCATLTNATLSGSLNVEVTGTGINSYTVVNGTSGGTQAKSINLDLLKTTACTLGIQGTFNTIDINASLAALNVTGDSTIYGNFVITSLGSWPGANNKILTFADSATFTTNGVTVGDHIAVNAPGATVTLGSALTIDAANYLQLTAGTFNANNYAVTVGSFRSNNSNTRTLTMGSGTWTLSDSGTVWDLATTTNLTFNKNTSNIVLSNTSNTARTFAGGNLTYNNLTIGGTTGTTALSFTGSNTFGTISSTKTVAHTIRFGASTTTTVTNWTVTGTAGNVVTINATAGTFTLTKSGGGTITGLDYLTIFASNATPADTWYAGSNSTDSGSNTGWIFTDGPVANTGNMFFMFN